MANQNAINAAKAAGTLCKDCGKISKELLEKIKKLTGTEVSTNRPQICTCSSE